LEKQAGWGELDIAKVLQYAGTTSPMYLATSTCEALCLSPKMDLLFYFILGPSKRICFASFS